MEHLGCPKCTLCTLGILDKLLQLLSFLAIEYPGSSWTLFDNKTIDAALIERFDPFLLSIGTYFCHLLYNGSKSINLRIGGAKIVVCATGNPARTKFTGCSRYFCN